MRLHRKFLVFFSLLFFSTLAQQDDYFEYYKVCNEARDAFDQKKYAESELLFNSAFKTVEIPLYPELEKAFLNQLKLGNNDRAKEYLISMAKLYGVGISKRRFETDSAYVYWKEISLPYENQKQLTFDRVYQNIIDSVFLVDQSLRSNGAFEYPNGVNIDSINTYYILSIIAKRGYPTPQKVSLKQNNKVHLIFLHADFDIDNILLGNLLYKALCKGWITPNYYASIHDRRMNFRGKSPYYYTAPFGYDDLDEGQKAEVTERREKIGLRSIEKSISYTFEDGVLKVESKD